MLMTIDRAVIGFTGSLVLIGLALGMYVNPYWYVLSAFVGGNLLQSAFTGFCPFAQTFRRIGLKRGTAF
jgi:hypothetical protein